MYSTLARAGKFLLQGKSRAVVSRQITHLQLALVRLVFLRKPGQPQFLDAQALEDLQSIYRRTADRDYAYDTDSLLQRGEERASVLEALIAQYLPEASRIVELGCGDGMTLTALASGDRMLTGIDHSDARFDPRATNRGVNFVKESVSRIELPDNSVDVVFSFNAFEHFSDPASVYGEIKRILRPGGIFYADFGPLYNSPWGLHGYDAIGVPFCQHLFRQETMDSYCDDNRIPRISFDYVNGWSHHAFKKLFQEQADGMDTIRFVTSISTHGIDLVLKHPRCFLGKTEKYDELISSSIEILQIKSGGDIS